MRKNIEKERWVGIDFSGNSHMWNAGSLADEERPGLSGI